MNHFWKKNWDDTKRRFLDWWQGKGFIVGSWNGVRSSLNRAVPDPGPAKTLESQWTDVEWRSSAARFQMSQWTFPLETLPVADPWFGPGSLALYLGSEPGFGKDTVWYHPCIKDPDSCGEIRFDPGNRWWRIQIDLIDRMIETAAGNYLVGCPDAVENWDTLASLRDAETLLMDMIERPAWVKDKIREINQAWFEAYDGYHRRIRAQDGESMFGWFRVWAPGKVAKVQCDGSSMFSPKMFREFVVPSLSEQCRRLDYSLYHLDGSQCLCHLDALLEVENLTAIEWTPEPNAPGGGSPHWHDMYRRIIRAGKRVQVLGASAHEMAPLLDAVGGNGVYFLSWFSNEKEAEIFESAAQNLRG